LDINFELNNPTLEIIAKNCDNLRKIKFLGQHIRSFYEIFGQKCGQNLESITIYGIDYEYMASLLRFSPNLKSIFLVYNFDALIKQYLPKLEVIKVNNFSADSFKKFTNLYQKQIKKLTTSHLSFNWQNCQLLSKFENLEFLSIDSNNQLFKEEFILFVYKLKKLKHLIINANQLNYSFLLLKVYKNLKNFELSLEEFRNEDMEVVGKLHLTKLQINHCFSGINDETLEKLSQMKTLTELCFGFEEITDAGICHLIKNISKLKTIYVTNKHINETTINAFTEIALNNPKINYKFIAQDYNRKRLTNNSIPKNLLIEKL
jgi:hypothetical protein